MPSKTTESARDIFDAGGRGLQHHGLRRANERAVLTVIGFNPGVSNADIARISGLAPQTVSAILTDIDKAGLIARGEVLRGRRGQPATPISLRAEGAFSVGVEIGWRHVDVLLLNLIGDVVAREHRTYDFPDARTIFDTIVQMLAHVTAGMSEDDRARMLDMGVALPTNLADHLTLVDAPADQYPLWAAIDVAAELTHRTGLHASLFNDGNAACWAELIAFPKPRPGTFIYFLISRFIAAGIVGEGTLWEGPTGNSANLGSMLVNGPAGKMQPAHFVASVTSLSQRLIAAGHAANIADLEHWDWDSFGEALDAWIADSADALAKVVFNTTTVIESSMVVVDAVIPAAIVQRLVEGLREQLRLLPIKPYDPPQVLAGHLGGWAPAIGASELVLYRRYFSRSLVDLAG
jgi:predicted NBD/HSP70 family sugar kinase/DNA-binding CsgD family transcriptional regulator